MITSSNSFKSHPLCFNRHLQTFLGVYLPSPWKTEETVTKMVRVDETDHLFVHDNCPENWQPGDRVIVLLHGLGGCHRSGYMQRIAAKLNALDFRTIRVDLRGFGMSQYTSRKHPHIGRSGDLDKILEYTMQACPRSLISVIGFSFGANILLKLLGEYSNEAPDVLDSAVAISPPIDVMACAKNLRFGLNRFYDTYFTSNLHKLIWKRRRTVRDMDDIAIGKLPDRLLQFDNQYTSILNGFKDAREYYTMSSSGPFLEQIAVPTLLICAQDDPIIPFDSYDKVKLSPAIELDAPAKGGHLGFIAKSAPDSNRDCRWMDWRIVDWLAAIEESSIEK